MKHEALFLFVHSHPYPCQRRPNKVMSDYHPSEKQTVAVCSAMTPSSYNDTSVPS